MSTELGKWEKHTKGLGSKLLNKMGYKPGEGLGKNNEGLVEAVVLEGIKGQGTLGQSRSKPKPAKKRPTSNRDLSYNTDSDSSSENDDSNFPEFVSDSKELDDSIKRKDDQYSTDEDEESVFILAKRLLASNKSAIDDLSQDMRLNKSKLKLLKETLSNYKQQLVKCESEIANLRNYQQLISNLETIDRNEKLTIKVFWDCLPSEASPKIRSHMIQVFALPILRRTFRRFDFNSNRIEEIQLENLLFNDIIEVFREWLKTRQYYAQLIEWYQECKENLKSILDIPRVSYFRRRLLDVMYLATINYERDLNSYKYVPFHESSLSGSSKGADGNRDSAREDSSRKLPLNFKQFVELIAEENGLLFRPLTGQTHESRQVFSMNNFKVYIDNKVIYVRLRDQWVPKTLNEAIEVCNT